jgi:hypothetical protein
MVNTSPPPPAATNTLVPSTDDDRVMVVMVGAAYPKVMEEGTVGTKDAPAVTTMA